MLKKPLFLLFFLINFFVYNLVSAENPKIRYVDIDKIVLQSEAGKKMNKSIDASIKKKNKEFQNIEENLKKKMLKL